MTDKSPFSGDGLSDDEFSEVERARHREMYREVSNAWPTISGLHDLIKGGKSLGKVLGGAAVIGAGIAYAVEMGLFG